MDDLSALHEKKNLAERVHYYTNAISKDSAVLLTMIDKLGYLLTSQVQENRETGLDFMNQVLQGVGDCSDEHAILLLEFYTSRLREGQTALRGLCALLMRHHFSSVDGVARAADCLVDHATLQPERFLVLSTLTHLMQEYPSGGHLFVSTCIRAVEGERDPRCLLQAFRLLHLLCSTYVLGDAAEALFDVCACYFPVDFSPVGGVVTREDLAEALERCLTASLAFGNMCVALAAEKLPSLDALHLLEAAARVFGGDCFRDHLPCIWKDLRDMLSTKREAVLTTLTAIARNCPRELLHVMRKDLDEKEVAEAFARASHEACAALLAVPLPFVTLQQLLPTCASWGLFSPQLDPVVEHLLAEEPDTKAAEALAAALRIPGLSVDKQRLGDSLMAYPHWTPQHGFLLGVLMEVDSQVGQQMFHFLCKEVLADYHSSRTPSALGKLSCVTGSYLVQAIDQLASRLPGDSPEHCELLCGSMLRSIESAERHNLQVPYDSLLQRLVTLAAEESVPLLRVVTRHSCATTVKEVLCQVLDGGHPPTWLLECLLSECPQQAVVLRPPLMDAVVCVACVVNKVEAQELEQVVKQVIPQAPWTRAKVDLLLWMTKGLLVRGYSNLQEYVALLCTLLGDCAVGHFVASNFEVLLRPSVLTAEGHCRICPMYAQRLFSLTAPVLVDALHQHDNNSAATQRNFVMALCCQLKYLPKIVTDSYIDQVLPSLLHVLDSGTDDTLVGLLPCLIDHVGVEQVDQLVHLAQLPHTMAVRQMALECLIKVAKQEVPQMVRRTVLRGLLPSLADHKRLVRQAAARASATWAMA
ncbi:uncharacterized protein LOC135377267 isoform X2 [Ornithodoros turicata]|uniref:uncharacterized protein LOC135377267 isoform X2 n=1 Tax=Ornithodoros turicata TaxID=34597 RepID=UPI003138FD16